MTTRPSPKNPRSGFTCVRCGHHCFERERVMGTNITVNGPVKPNWCQPCADEDDASIKKTAVPGLWPAMYRDRLPSHMQADCNDPVKWRKT